MRRTAIAFTLIVLAFVAFDAQAIADRCSNQPVTSGSNSGMVRLDWDPTGTFALITVAQSGSAAVDVVLRVQRGEGPVLPAHAGPGRVVYSASRVLIAFEDGQSYVLRVGDNDKALTPEESRLATYEIAGLAHYSIPGKTADDVVATLLPADVTPMVGQCTNCKAGGVGSAACSIFCYGDGSCSVNCNTQLGYYACCGCWGLFPTAGCICCRGKGEGAVEQLERQK